MSDISRHHAVPTETAAHCCQSPLDGIALEPQGRECELSDDARRFLHDLHVAERQLNAAFSVARQGGELEQRIRQVYREMFGRE
jgi:tellurite resistance protein